MTEQTITHEFAHTALCIWEAWLDTTDRERAWDDYRANHGAVESRHACIHMAPQIEAVWAAMSEDARDVAPCYDWEFVPLMMAEFSYSCNGSQYPILMHKVEDIAARLSARFTADL